MACLATSVAGGIAGAAAAGVAAAKVGATAGTAVSPGVGTIVGLAGGMVGGTVGTAAAGEYLLDGHEMDELLAVLNSVKPEEFKALMEETLSSQFQEAKVRAFLAPMFDEIVSRRERFALPTDVQISDALVKFEQDAEEKPTA